MARVLIRSCPDYDSDRIRRIVREGLETLDLRPHGRTLVKPNAVAAGRFFPHAYTRPEFLKGVLEALRDRAEGPLEELALGERCGITMPTRFAFDQAGYYRALRGVPGLRFRHFEEEVQVPIPLYHDGRLRDHFYTPTSVASADFFVNCPKFKAHPWTTVTFSMKAYIGIQDDRHRLLDHDHLLERKVADLQYALQPRFIAIDAITAGEGRMLTPLPFDLGLVLMGDNQLAFDVVCCHVAGVDPRQVEHLRVAHERGFGPIDLDDIQIGGDVSLDEARERAQGFRTGLIRVDDYFRGTSIRAYGGRPPGDTHDYCWGGCPGALEEAIEILRIVDAATDAKMPKLHLVFGKVDRPIVAEPGEKVIFIGDCAEYDGEIGGAPVHIENLYVDRSQRSPEAARDKDIFAKMLEVQARLFATRNQPVMRLAGCPVSVAEQVLALVHLGRLKNPYLVPDVSAHFVSAYFSTRMRTALSRLLGRPHTQPAAVRRGDARPPQSLPPPGTATRFEAPPRLSAGAAQKIKED